jgi:hypothetical protein
MTFAKFTNFFCLSVHCCCPNVLFLFVFPRKISPFHVLLIFALNCNLINIQGVFPTVPFSLLKWWAWERVKEIPWWFTNHPGRKKLINLTRRKKRQENNGELKSSNKGNFHGKIVCYYNKCRRNKLHENLIKINSNGNQRNSFIFHYPISIKFLVSFNIIRHQI